MPLQLHLHRPVSLGNAVVREEGDAPVGQTEQEVARLHPFLTAVVASASTVMVDAVVGGMVVVMAMVVTGAALLGQAHEALIDTVNVTHFYLQQQLARLLEKISLEQIIDFDERLSAEHARLGCELAAFLDEAHVFGKVIPEVEQ